MSSSLIFTITDAGASAVARANEGGPRINITQVKLGAAVNYTPLSTDTGLHGSVRYTGGINDYSVDGLDQVNYLIALDESIGDFTFGEIGLFLDDGTLFALTALSVAQEKVKAKPGSPGNRVSFKAKLSLTRLAPTITFDFTTIVNAKIIEIGSFSALPLASDVDTTNAFVVDAADDSGLSGLVVRDSILDLWSITTHRTPLLSGTVDSGTTTTTVVSTEISSLLNNKVVAGKYVIQFISGNRKSYVRHVLTATSGRVTVEDLLTAPTVGSQFIIYVSDYSILRRVADSQQQLLGEAVIKPIFFNAKVIAEDLKVTADINGHSSGPIKIQSGNRVVVEPGARWVIV